MGKVINQTRQKVLIIDKASIVLRYYEYLLRSIFPADEVEFVKLPSEDKAIEYSLAQKDANILCCIMDLDNHAEESVESARHLKQHWPQSIFFVHCLSRIDDLQRLQAKCWLDNIFILDKNESMRSTIIPWIKEQLQTVKV